MADLNPQITTLSVGTKSLREVTIYPLSMADQFKMTDALVSAFSKFSEVTSEHTSDAAIVATMVKLIEDNLQELLDLVLADGESITFDELTNDQFSDLVMIIYEVNYESTIKKFRGLVEKVKGVIGPKKKGV